MKNPPGKRGGWRKNEKERNAPDLTNRKRLFCDRHAGGGGEFSWQSRDFQPTAMTHQKPPFLPSLPPDQTRGSEETKNPDCLTSSRRGEPVPIEAGAAMTGDRGEAGPGRPGGNAKPGPGLALAQLGRRSPQPPKRGKGGPSLLSPRSKRREGLGGCQPRRPGAMGVVIQRIGRAARLARKGGAAALGGGRAPLPLDPRGRTPPTPRPRAPPPRPPSAARPESGRHRRRAPSYRPRGRGVVPSRLPFLPPADASPRPGWFGGACVPSWLRFSPSSGHFMLHCY